MEASSRTGNVALVVAEVVAVLEAFDEVVVAEVGGGGTAVGLF